MKRKYIIIAIIAVLVLLIVIQLVSNKKAISKKEQPAKDSVALIPVKTAKVASRQQEINLVKTGTVAPFKESTVISTLGGTITELRFNLGDQVQQGQVLAKIDTRLLELDLSKALSKAAKLKNDLRVYTELLAGQAATQEKVNEIRQDYLDAQNEVNQVRKQIMDAAVKAPTSGTVAEKLIEQGVFAPVGTEIVKIVNLSQAKVRLNLTETEVYQARAGQDIKITTDVYLGKVFNGRITFISPQADETHNYLVEIIAQNTNGELLRSGTFVYADFSRKTTQNVLLIPREALIEGKKNASVYVLSGDTVKKRTITAGAEVKDMIQVTDGLKEGDIVITSGQINLREGSKVSISK